MRTPQHFNSLGAENLPGHLGIVFTHSEPREVRAELTVKPMLMAPNGFLHAGSIVTLADTAAGYGCLNSLPQNASGFTTIELKSNHLGTARDGTIDCVATAVHVGKTTQVWTQSSRTGKPAKPLLCSGVRNWCFIPHRVRAIEVDMSMKKTIPAESPDAYVKALSGWRKNLVAKLRRATLSAGELEEQIKWGHLVYSANGPVLLIRAEEHRVLFGFWRGQLLREFDHRLKPGGKYEMATMVFAEKDKFTAAQAKALVVAAIALNVELGDPTDLKK